MERSSDLPILLTTKEIAHILHLHVNTVRRWERHGVIRAYRIGPRGERSFEQNEILHLISETGNKNSESQ